MLTGKKGLKRGLGKRWKASPRNETVGEGYQMQEVDSRKNWVSYSVPQEEHIGKKEEEKKPKRLT